MTKEQAISILDEIQEISMEGSITGSLRNGYKYSLRVINRIKDLAVKQEWIDPDLFEELTEENCNNIDCVAVAAAMMKAAIK